MNEFWKEWRKEILLGFGILFLALTLRLFNLNSIPIFGDEAIYIRWSQIMRVEPGLRFVPLSDGKQPLFMWVVIPFLKLIHDPLIGGRIVSVFAGMGTLIGVYVLSFILFESKKVSLAASLIYAVSPFSVFFDRLALADSMLSMFGIWTLIFASITAKKVRLDTAILTGFALGGALLTKSPGLFFALIVPTTLILHDWPKKLDDKFKRIVRFGFLFGFAFLIAFGMYNILRLGENFHMIALRNADYVYPYSHVFESAINPFWSHFKAAFDYLWQMGPSVLIILVGFGAYFGLTKKWKSTLVVLAATLPILVVLEFSKTLTARYVYFAIPYIFILAGLAFYQTKRKFITLVNIVFVLFILHSLYIDFNLLISPQKANLPRSERSGYLEEWTAGYGIYEASKYLKSEFQQNPDRKIVVGTEGYFGTLPDGLQIYLNDQPEITVIGVGIDLKEIPLPLAESYNFGNDTYLLINDSRLKFDPENAFLQYVAAYPKADAPDGSHESLYLYKLTNSK